MSARQGKAGLRLAVLAMALGAALAAQTATAGGGVVQQIAGTISVQKPDGSVRTLNRQSEVDKGDTLNTEKDSYVQVKFADGGVVTLKPNTRVKIDNYVFDVQAPAKDSSTLSLLKGGLRMISGLIGHRGNPDAFKANTATATIGVRGTTFTIEDCLTTACVKRGATRVGMIGATEYASIDGDTRNDGAFSPDPDRFNAWVAHDRAVTQAREKPLSLDTPLVAQNAADCGTGNPADCLPPAVIVGVSDGEIIVSNSSGAPVSYRAGQWGMVSNFNSRPLTLPGDPGLPIYQPPATFFQNISAGGIRNSSTQCIVN
ncbi:MAG TPA: FecR family protein [Burkholderiales bacterium]